MQKFQFLGKKIILKIQENSNEVSFNAPGRWELCVYTTDHHWSPTSPWTLPEFLLCDHLNSEPQNKSTDCKISVVMAQVMAIIMEFIIKLLL